MKKVAQTNNRFTVDLSEDEYNALCRLVQIIPDYHEGDIASDEGVEVSSLLKVVLSWLQGNFYLEAMQLHLNQMKDLWHGS